MHPSFIARYIIDPFPSPQLRKTRDETRKGLTGERVNGSLFTGENTGAAKVEEKSRRGNSGTK